MTFTLDELSRKVNGKLSGDPACEIDSVGELSSARPGQISFLSNPAYRQYLASTRASVVILTKADRDSCPVNSIVVDDPYLAYAHIANLLHPAEKQAMSGIHPSAVVSETAKIHQSVNIGPLCTIDEGVIIQANVVIGPGCVIGRQVNIGEASRLEGNVTIWHDTQIGKHCLIHSGVVIGADGFGIVQQKDGKWINIPQLGNVTIGNDVEIGANTTVDRGALNDTVLEDGVKIDNLCQIAHNVHIGANTVIASSTAIAGSAKIGNNCKIAGCVGIVGHIEITDNVVITAMSMVTKSINNPGVYSSGMLLEENKHWHKNAVRFKQLDKIAKQVKKLSPE